MKKIKIIKFTTILVLISFLNLEFSPTIFALTEEYYKKSKVKSQKSKDNNLPEKEKIIVENNMKNRQNPHFIVKDSNGKKLFKADFSPFVGNCHSELDSESKKFKSSCKEVLIDAGIKLRGKIRLSSDNQSAFIQNPSGQIEGIFDFTNFRESKQFKINNPDGSPALHAQLAGGVLIVSAVDVIPAKAGIQDSGEGDTNIPIYQHSNSKISNLQSTIEIGRLDLDRGEFTPSTNYTQATSMSFLRKQESTIINYLLSEPPKGQVGWFLYILVGALVHSIGVSKYADAVYKINTIDTTRVIGSVIANHIDPNNKFIIPPTTLANSSLGVSINDGSLHLSHSLPLVKIMNSDFSLTFHYNSTSVLPSSVIVTDFDTETYDDSLWYMLYLNYDPNSNDSKVPNLFIKYKITDENIKGRIPYVWNFDSDTETGVYRYLVEIFGINSSVSFTKRIYTSGFTVVQNEINSSFGKGWSLGGLMKIYYPKKYYEGIGSILLLTMGDSSAKIFKLNEEKTSAGYDYWDSVYGDPSNVINTKKSDNSFYRNPCTEEDNTRYLYEEKGGSKHYFNDNGFLQCSVDRNNNKIKYSYTSSNSLSEIEIIPSGENSGPKYLINGSSITDPVGRTTSFNYGSITNPDGKSVSLAYNNSGLINSVTDKNGKLKTIYNYNELNRVQSVEVREVQSNDLLTKQEFQHGIIKNALNNNYNLVVVDKNAISSLCCYNTVTYSKYWGLYEDYPANAELVNLKDYYDKVTFNSHESNEKTYTYYGTNTFGSIVTQIDATGRGFYLERNNKNDRIETMKKIFCPGGSYDVRECNIINCSIITYNERSNILSKVLYRPDCSTPITNTVYTYPESGSNIDLPISQQTGSGALINFVYDSRGNLTTSKLIKSTNEIETTIYTYYDNGIHETTTNPLGHTSRLNYNDKWNLDESINPNGKTIKYFYDSKTNLDYVEDGAGKQTDYTYDENTNLLRTVKDADNNEINYDYDANGNLTRVTARKNGTNQITENQYDALYRVIESKTKISGEGYKIRSFVYDSNGNLKSSTDASNKTTTFTYKHNYLMSATLPDGEGALTYGYDEAGNVSKITDSDSEVTFIYDSANRLTATQQKINIGEPLQKDLEYSYDANGNRKSMKALRKVGLVVGDWDIKLNYEYDSANRLNKITYPGKDEINFTYDDDAGRRTQTMIKSLEILGNKVITNYTYDKLVNEGDVPNGKGMLTKIENKTMTYPPLEITTISSYTYPIYDAVGNREQMQTKDGEHDYVYDNLYQLIEADHPINYPFPDEEYHYDSLGNRTSSHLSSSYSYDPYTNQLTSTSDGQCSYIYNNNGNMTQKTCGNETTEYKYDSKDQLIGIKHPDIPNDGYSEPCTEYFYDSLGRRIAKKQGIFTGTETEWQCYTGPSVAEKSKLIKYIYDGDDIIAEYEEKLSGEHKGKNILNAKFIHGPGVDEPLIMYRDTDGDRVFLYSEKFYYMKDGLGSITELVRFISDGNSGYKHEVVAQYRYDSFGNLSQSFNPEVSQTLINSLTHSLIYSFTGREYDSESGLYYYRARYYDPKIGRFLQEGPEFALNLYPYVGNNPVNFIDPSGESINMLLIALALPWIIAWNIAWQLPMEKALSVGYSIFALAFLSSGGNQEYIYGGEIIYTAEVWIGKGYEEVGRCTGLVIKAYKSIGIDLVELGELFGFNVRNANEMFEMFESAGLFLDKGKSPRVGSIIFSTSHVGIITKVKNPYEVHYIHARGKDYGVVRTAKWHNIGWTNMKFKAFSK